MNKKKIAILVDSGTDVPQEIIQKYGMYVIPLQIIYKDRTYTDKVDITPQEVYDRFEEEIPSTSLPDGETISAIFEQIQKDGFEKVLAVTISSGLSGTCNMVRLMSESFPELDTFVLDTKNIGIGSGLQAVYAAELIEQGMDWAELKVILQKEVKKAKVFFNVATLKYLQKGGRIGLVTSVIGTALKLNPIISCNDDGVYYTVAKTRGRKKSIEKTMELVADIIGNHKRFSIAVAQGDADEEGQHIFHQMKERFPQAEHLFYGPISPALVVHTGPGLLGIGVQVYD